MQKVGYGEVRSAFMAFGEMAGYPTRSIKSRP